ncbi:MAG: hypothetical protein ACP5GI_06275 [Sulfolobales archaeon]
MEEIKLPLHISGLWKPVYGDSYLETGSLGIGLVLEPLTKIFLKESGECFLKINGICYEINHVKLAREIYGLQDFIEVYQEIPLGAGAGLSANISVAIGYSVSRRFLQDHITRIIFAGLVGHELEVSLKTGLGDVISELIGYGIEVRKKPGPPCFGDLINIDVNKDLLITVFVLPRRIYTPNMLATYSSDLAKLFDRLYYYFLDEPSIERFFEISNKFSKEIGFLNRDIEEKINLILREQFTSGDIIGFFVKKSLIIIGHINDSSLKISDIRNTLPIEKIAVLRILKKSLVNILDKEICSEITRKYFDLKKIKSHPMN